MQSINNPQNQDSREANLITAYSDVCVLKKEVRLAYKVAQRCQDLKLRNELKLEAAELNYKAESILEEILECVDPVKGILVC
jgi:hypothetical protein